MSGPTPPASFEPLDSRNGVPGDVGELTALARRYAGTAAEIEAQANNLRRLTSQARGGWKGEAGENFATIAGELAERIGRAQGRYDAAARAVTEFANRLDDVQTAAYGAVRRAQDAEDAQRALRASAPTPPGPAATPEQLTVAREEQRLHERAETAATSELAAARRDYERAVADYHQAAGDAARTLRAGRSDDGLADSWWDRNAGWISDVLDVVGAIVLVLAIVVLVIGVVATGGLLLAAMPVLIALSAISFAGHLALWITDNGSGADVLWDLAGLLTFGLGAGVARGVRGLVGVASRAGGGAAATTAGRQAFTTAGRSTLLYDVSRRVPFAREILSLSPGLRATVSTADEQAALARAEVLALAGAPSTPLSRSLMLGDTSAAQAMTATSRIRQAVPDGLAVEAVTGLARSLIVGENVVDTVLDVQAVIDTYGDFVLEPAEEGRAQVVRAEIVEQWSIPLMHVR